MSEKNENMNKESILSIKEFRKKQIQTNIKIHIFVLIMMVIINTILIIFIIYYKSKVRELTSKTNINSVNLTQGTYYIKSLESSLLHKMVNILSSSSNIYGTAHFSFLLETSEEVQSIKDSIKSCIGFHNPQLIPAYESNIQDELSSTFLNSMKYWLEFLIIVGAKTGEKFALFFQDYQSSAHKCFLFSFKNKKHYECKGKNVLQINHDYPFNIGNYDIIINKEFKTNGGEINFPFKIFDIQEENEFSKLNGHFDIKDIEIYLVFELTGNNGSN